VTEKLNDFGPLNGIRIVEMCTYVAAPATVRVLSEMGAEIIKIESFDGDIQRTQGPGFGCALTDTEDPTIDLNNTNKNWVSLNLKHEEGLRIAKQLIGEADIFVNNMRTSALQKLGLDYPTLKEEFPGLVWAQIRGYGEYGEFAHSPGYDAVCWAARGGVAGTFPEKGTSPAIPPQAFGDYNTATMMAAGILGALVNKLRTGKGDKVVVNLYHAAIWGGSIGICAQQFGADYPKSRKNVPNPFNNTYKTADDKWIYICQPQHNRYYNDMMKIINREDLVDDPRYATIENIKEQQLQAELIAILEEGFATKTLDEWLPVLAQWQVPSQKVFRFNDILNDDEAYVNDALRVVTYEAFGKHALPTTPIRYESYGDPPIVLSKPIGYHTVECLRKQGYHEDRIAELEADGAIKCYHGKEVADPIFWSQRKNESATKTASPMR
jgi:crotonobetainyl-CoA:carnitine CoA-transferase CaiB-like acyl-CoA transferase